MSEGRKIRIPLAEWRSKHWEEARERRASLATEQRDTTTIAGMFAEALGCLEDAWNYLRQIDEQGQKQYADDVSLVAGFGLRPCHCLLYTSPSPRDRS